MTGSRSEHTSDSPPHEVPGGRIQLKYRTGRVRDGICSDQIRSGKTFREQSDQIGSDIRSRISSEPLCYRCPTRCSGEDGLVLILQTLQSFRGLWSPACALNPPPSPAMSTLLHMKVCFEACIGARFFIDKYKPDQSDRTRPGEATPLSLPREDAARDGGGGLLRKP